MESVEVYEEKFYVWDCPNCEYVNENFGIEEDDTVECSNCFHFFEVIRQY